MMPVLDGWTFCKVRQGVAMLMEIPVVAISAAPMNGSHQPLRVDATLPKPFDPDALAWLATRMAGHKASAIPRNGTDRRSDQNVPTTARWKASSRSWCTGTSFENAHSSADALRRKPGASASVPAAV